MRCNCFKCTNNDVGYCGCYDSIEIDENGECSSLNILLSSEDNTDNTDSTDDYYSCTAINNNVVYIVSGPFKDKSPKIDGEKIAEAVNSTKQYKRKYNYE